MKRNLDNLDDSSEDIIQDPEGEELFDGTLYSDRPLNRFGDTRRGFVEDLEARVDAILEQDAEEEEFNAILMADDLAFDPSGGSDG